MKAFAVSLGAMLALSGCTIESEEDQLENSIRQNLSAQGNVQQVELSRQDDNNLRGFAVVRTAEGVESRYNCTARRTEGTNFQWNCLQTIDDQVITRMENNIRQELSNQAEVVQVELSRQDDNRMSGYALVRDEGGSEVRMDCSATRQDPASTNFRWECAPAR